MVRGVPLANPFVHNLQGRRLLRSGGTFHLPTKSAEAGIFILSLLIGQPILLGN